MRILVCGGRDYVEASFLFAALDKLHAKRPITLIIEGGALGADRLGRWWAKSRCVPFETEDADWKRYGDRAGSIRNSVMITKWKPEGVVAFPGNRGTADMIRQAKFNGIKVWQPKPRS